MEILKDLVKKILLKGKYMRLTDEYISDYVVTIYNYLFDRHPDKKNLAIYRQRIRNLESNGFKEILVEIFDSDEFKKNFIKIDSDEFKKNIIRKSDDAEFIEAAKLTSTEIQKKYSRTNVINTILSYKGNKTNYLEIGVRNLDDNFNLINAETKYCVDPGIETQLNNADFKLDSDEFFKKLSSGEILSSDYKFDVIFIDGLHLASQVERDIDNALNFLKEDGFIILHDCNPPTEWHARENFEFKNSPADLCWNGTVWKAFLKKRFDDSLKCCCIDTDWGVGIISKNLNIGSSIKINNPFFEYKEFEKKRNYYLNLISFEEFETILKNNF